MVFKSYLDTLSVNACRHTKLLHNYVNLYFFQQDGVHLSLDFANISFANLFLNLEEEVLMQYIKRDFQRRNLILHY